MLQRYLKETITIPRSRLGLLLGANLLTFGMLLVVAGILEGIQSNLMTWIGFAVGVLGLVIQILCIPSSSANDDIDAIARKGTVK